MVMDRSSGMGQTASGMNANHFNAAGRKGLGPSSAPDGLQHADSDEVGHLFQSEAGRHSDAKSATQETPFWVMG
jgi:hypothetical protein